MRCGRKFNMKKISKIDIILTVITIIFILIPSVIIYMDYREKKEQEEILAMGYTEHDLHYGHLNVLMRYLDICPPEYRKTGFFDKYECSPKKKDLKLEPGKYADEQIQKVNEIIFCDPEAEMQKAAAEQYGFSETNPITIKWVLENPKEMFDILMADEGYHSPLEKIELSMAQMYGQ